MTADQENAGVPAKRTPTDPQIRPHADQTVAGFLPKTGVIETDERISIAQDEGFDPMAIELALKPSVSTASDKLRLIILILTAAILVGVLFPLDRFFKPAPRDIGPMSIGGPILEESLTPANIRNKPWLKVLVKIDQLYYQEGKLSEAIEAAESELAKVPEKDWEKWQKLYYRYWELLSDAGRVHVLKTSTRAYLNAFPEDPFANYYYAQAYLTATDRIRSFTPESKMVFRQEAEVMAQQIDRACSAIDAQRQHPTAKKDKITVLETLYQKLRLEQAKLYVLIWKLGDYEEDSHPDVVYRDKALEITESKVLYNVKEAKKIKADIYTHILDRWYWYEGQQIIQSRKQKRKDLKESLETLNREIKATEKQ